MNGNLSETKTLANLQAAFTEECQCSFVYRYLAEKADKEGYPRAAAALRKVADDEAKHAMGHLRYLGKVELPHLCVGLGYTEDNLNSAVATENYQSQGLYPTMSKEAREEGFDEIADWFDKLAKAEQALASELLESLESIG